MSRTTGKGNKQKKNEGLKRSYSFPAVFDYDEDGISVSFPDLPGVFTCGDDEEDAYRNAKEALGLHAFGMEQDCEKIPTPSKVNQLSLESNQAVVIVNVFMPLIRDRIQKATLKKTLTIPKWINDLAEENHINFSQVLQEALKERLDINDPYEDNDFL
ncbi:type II toxin-antitoxin system HicB family antitoxin [Rummeliibacillus stabekisii]|uniref:type II toxin-antitoxin system HicB family antitoxin n=1 Tax=Rummeliibacillus stabekisii TaxID=241244 RepID=UPI001170A924|nr:type II toxin-antitoxin system HicB family antitoxin [Rummeliibacillus stabekisii]MBB5171554.1 putative RNase H-like HicB family nuclease [Rummeliibacillus stabekisii]GEL05522.1 HicB family protein [Rummeliibacillus stabekisii]